MSIKTLSPHYLEIPLTNPSTTVVCESYVLKLYIWDGDKTAGPSTPTYAITKINAAGLSGTEKINISHIVNDFIEFGCEPQTGTIVVDGKNQVWVTYEVLYSDTPEVPSILQTNIAIKGYGWFLEGENPQLPANKILLTGDEFKVSRNGVFILPFIIDELPADKTISIDLFTRKTGNYYELEVTANFAYTNLIVYVRPVGETEWVAAGTGSAPLWTVPISIASSVFEVMVTAVDTETSEVITSSTYTITALKIYRILPSDGGHAIAVYFQSNIYATVWTLQLYGYYSPGVWNDMYGSATSPIYQSFTPTGPFIARIRASGFYSNEVSFVIPLTETIDIP